MANDAFGCLASGVVDAHEALQAFRLALEARGIVVPEALIADGLLHRCDAAGRNGKGDAAYLLHLDGTPAGGFINWRDGREWESRRLLVGPSFSGRATGDAAAIRSCSTGARGGLC